MPHRCTQNRYAFKSLTAESYLNREATEDSHVYLIDHINAQ